MPPTQKPTFTQRDEDLIFQTARDQVLATVLGEGGPTETEFSASLGELADVSLLGTFVSFKKNGELRSCMGWMSEGIALAEALRQSAITAAKDDPRFAPIARSELDKLTMEVWVLWGMEEVPEQGQARLGAFEIGRHGIQVKSANRRGLLLPGVAVEHKMSPLEFLEATCRKAGLAKDAWRGDSVTLYRFEGLAIERPFLDDDAEKRIAASPVPEQQSRESYSWNFRPLAYPAAVDSACRPVRPAAVAGMFYPAGIKARHQLLDALFSDENQDETRSEAKKIRAEAILIPHAGWVYSGRLAAKTLQKVEIPETVMIFAPKHRAEGGSFAVAPNLTWDFGGETLESDPELAEAFCRAVEPFRFDAAAHAREHAVEVQLPLLRRLRPDVRVVGVVVGQTRTTDIFAAAERFGTFLETLEKSPLLIISSDMNHFENEQRTRQLDRKALEALETLDAKTLCSTVLGNGITMCGVWAAAFVLAALKQAGRLHDFEKIGYTTSAESSGDTDRVVGYAGYLFH